MNKRYIMFIFLMLVIALFFYFLIIAMNKTVFNNNVNQGKPLVEYSGLQKTDTIIESKARRISPQKKKYDVFKPDLIKERAEVDKKEDSMVILRPKDILS